MPVPGERRGARSGRLRGAELACGAGARAALPFLRIPAAAAHALRNPDVAAADLDVAGGDLEAMTNRGSRRAPESCTIVAMTNRPERPSVPYGIRGEAVRGSAIDASMSILARLNRPVISFAMGSPAADAIPRAEIAALAAEALASTDTGSSLDYAPTEGLPALRAALLMRLWRQGVGVDPDGLVVTAGGMQGLDLVCRLFLDPGDLVLAESPSYTSGLATLHNNGARIVQVPMDAGGMDLAAAEAAAESAGGAGGARPRLIYAIPTFQNPSGITYSPERRVALLELARRWGALVIEDDPYGELAYDGVAVPPSLRSLDGGDGGHVIAVHTFAKIVAPGMRVGWVLAPADTARRMVDLRQSMDTCANTLSQRIIAGLIASGGLDRHVAELRALYPRRRDAMLRALEAELGSIPGVSWTRPSGGMFVWLDLPPGVDGADVLRVGLDRGVAVVPGGAFDPERCRSAVRLCFTAQNEASIAEGVRRLASAVREVAATS